MKYYAIYDMNDNFVDICFNYKQLSNWFKKPIKSMQCGVCRFLQGKIDFIRSNDDHKNYKVYKMVDLQD